jgi:ankyrin repeat protein
MSFYIFPTLSLALCWVLTFSPVLASPVGIENHSAPSPTTAKEGILITIQAGVLLLECLLIILELAFKFDAFWPSKYRLSALSLRTWHRRALLLTQPVIWTLMIFTNIGLSTANTATVVCDNIVVDQDETGIGTRATMYGFGTMTGLTAVLGHFHAEESGIMELGLVLWISMASNGVNLVKSFFSNSSPVNIFLAILQLDGFISVLSVTLTMKEYLSRKWRLISTVFLQAIGLIVIALAVRFLTHPSDTYSSTSDNPSCGCFEAKWWGTISACHGVSISFWLYFATRIIAWTHEIVLLLCHAASYSLAKKLREEDHEINWKPQTSTISSTVYDSIPATVFSSYLPSLMNILYVCISIEMTLRKYSSRDTYLLKTWGQSAQLLAAVWSGYRWLQQIMQMFARESIEKRRIVLARCSMGTQIPDIGLVTSTGQKNSIISNAKLWVRTTYYNHPLQKFPPRRFTDHARFATYAEAWKEILLDYRQWPKESPDKKGQMLLEGAKQGDLTMISDLLQEEAPIDYADTEGYTALHFATENSHPRIVSKLLEHGAASNQQDSIRMETPLHIAGRTGNKEITEDLLDHGASPNVPDSVDGWTPLHVAARHGHVDIWKMLIRHPRYRANPNAQAMKGKTALHLLLRHGQAGVEELAGASNPDAVDGKGKTALFLAARYDRLEGTIALLKQNANPNITTTVLGYTPLLACARWDRTEIARILLKHGCHAEIKEKEEGRTALHLAANYGREEVVDHLLRAGVDVDAFDSHERTPIYYAAKDDRECTRKLLRHGAKVKLGDTTMMRKLLQQYGVTLEKSSALVEEESIETILEVINGQQQ